MTSLIVTISYYVTSYHYVTGKKADETKRNTTLELPYYSKFLLIAAYLASYNSPKTDKRFFLKNAGKIRKRTKAARGPEIKQKMVGPLTFSIDRNCSPSKVGE